MARGPTRSAAASASHPSMRQANIFLRTLQVTQTCMLTCTSCFQSLALTSLAILGTGLHVSIYLCLGESDAALRRGPCYRRPPLRGGPLQQGPYGEGLTRRAPGRTPHRLIKGNAPKFKIQNLKSKIQTVRLPKGSFPEPKIQQPNPKVQNPWTRAATQQFRVIC